MTRSSDLPTRRGLLAASGAALAASLAGCASGSDGESNPDADATVEVGPNSEYVFEPGTDEPLTVESGATVAFVWKSGSHNVVPTGQPLEAGWQGHAGIEGTGFSFTHSFETPGTYEYVCEPHEALGMVGTLVVEE